LKKENVNENLGKARLSIRQFSPFNLSILNRMSFLAGFAELGRLAALTVPAFSLQLPKRGMRHES